VSDLLMCRDHLRAIYSSWIPAVAARVRHPRVNTDSSCHWLRPVVREGEGCHRLLIMADSRPSAVSFNRWFRAISPIERSAVPPIIRDGEEVYPPRDEACVTEPRSYFDSKVCQS
jgi:hypothetical protein